MALSGRGDGEFSNMIYNQNTDRNVWESNKKAIIHSGPKKKLHTWKYVFFFAPLNANFTHMLNINHHVNYMPDDYPE